MIRLASETDREYEQRKAEASPFYQPMRTLYARTIAAALKSNNALSSALKAGRVRDVAREISREPL